MTENTYLDMLRRAKMSLPTSAASERWEIPRATVQTSGKKRTIIRNFLEIAKAVRREPVHIAKFMFKELAVPGGVMGDTLELQGKFGTEQINRRLDDYVKEFILCSECSKPDTHLIKKDRLWFLRCEACGAQKSVRSV